MAAIAQPSTEGLGRVRVAMPVAMTMPVMAETVRMSVAVCVAIAVAVRLGLCVRMWMHLVPIVRACDKRCSVWRVRHALPKLSVRFAFKALSGQFDTSNWRFR